MGIRLVSMPCSEPSKKRRYNILRVGEDLAVPRVVRLLLAVLGKVIKQLMSCTSGTRTSRTRCATPPPRRLGIPPMRRIGALVPGQRLDAANPARQRRRVALHG